MIECNNVQPYKTNLINFTLLLLALMLQKVFAAVSINFPISIIIVWGLAALVLYLCYYATNKIFIPMQFTLCQLWIISMMVLAVIIAPVVIEYNFKIKRIAYEFVYYEVLFFYLLVGYNICKVKRGYFFLRCISFASVGIASIAVFTELFNIGLFRKIFYLSGAGIRFSGIMGNPNDYLPVTLVSIAYFFVAKQEKKGIRFLAIGILIFSVLAAGSKGGIVSLVLYCLFILIKWFLTGNKSHRIVSLIFLGILTGSALFVLIDHEAISNFLFAHSSSFPGGDRFIRVLADPRMALQDSGSLRLQCWYGAYLIIKESLLLGAGIGGHDRILEVLNYEYSYLTPHNLYLELIAQSGLLICLIILMVCIHVVKRSIKSDVKEAKILRHTMFLLLTNGLYFASNWSITFWFVAGMLCCCANQSEVEKCQKKVLV